MTVHLKQHRDQIDAIDEQVLKLVNERAQLARQIGALKDDGVIYRPEREAQVLRRLQANNAGPLSNEAVSNIFRAVMSNCRALEKELSIAFLGPLGTYSEEAALKQFGLGKMAVVCASIDEVFRSVEAAQVDYGVVPVENSTEGAIGLTLDLLLASSLKICGEVTLPIHHCLLSKQTDISQISHVFSHTQSLAQCHEWLSKHLPKAECQGRANDTRSGFHRRDLCRSHCQQTCSRFIWLKRVGGKHRRRRKKYHALLGARCARCGTIGSRQNLAGDDLKKHPGRHGAVARTAR